jgi:hypothetical protein
MAGMAEAHLAFLAIEQAGHVPCLLPVTWDEESGTCGPKAATKRSGK